MTLEYRIAPSLKLDECGSLALPPATWSVNLMEPPLLADSFSGGNCLNIGDRPDHFECIAADWIGRTESSLRSAATFAIYRQLGYIRFFFMPIALDFRSRFTLFLKLVYFACERSSATAEDLGDPQLPSSGKCWATASLFDNLSCLAGVNSGPGKRCICTVG